MLDEEKKTKDTAEEIVEESVDEKVSQEAEADAVEEAAAEAVEEAKTAEGQNAEQDKRVEELTDRLQRLMAEFDNFRKRTDREKSEMFDNGVSSFIAKLLPVVDNFERGLASVEGEGKEDPFYQGIEQIYKQLMEVLEGVEVRPIEAVGKEFDPNYHNAVMHDTDDAYGENTVVEEFQKGYTYKEKVVRYSMVKVVN